VLFVGQHNLLGVHRRFVIDAGVTLMRVILAFDNSNTVMRVSVWVLNVVRSSNSHSSAAKKFLHMALPWASPTDPIEGRIPASRQRLPKAIEANWQPWPE
jgi:hypothetical protein